MMNMYGNYLPNKKSFNRIILKSLFGVLAGGVLFSLFFLVTDTIQFLFIDPKDASYSISSFFSVESTIFVGVTVWTLAFASIPTVIGGILLSGIIYKDFKFGIASKSRAVITGLFLAGVVGLSISIFVAFTAFRPSDTLSALRFTIPVTLIASLIGAWGGLQVYKEIYSEFMSADRAKENNR